MASISETIRQIRSYPRHRNPETGKMELDAFAWPGGYPIIAITTDGDVACVDCVNSEDQFVIGTDKYGDGWKIAGVQAHYEGFETCCHCNKVLAGAYEDDC